MIVIITSALGPRRNQEQGGGAGLSELDGLNCPVAESFLFRAQELCESRGGRPGLPSLINLRFLWTSWAPVPNKPTVSVDVLGSRP